MKSITMGIALTGAAALALLAGPVVAGAPRSASAGYVRPADTTTYASGDAWADSVSAPAYLTFQDICPGPSQHVALLDLLVTDNANQTIKLTGELWLFGRPPTALNDNAAFNVSAADMANLRTVIAFSPATAGNQNAGASGWTMDNQTNLGRAVKCHTGDTSLYGLVRVTNAYVPVSGEVLTFLVRTLGLNN